ncbi:unnamed protein product [Mytilus coruscus]|uniref:Phospholipid scramblase n=1 Tax=Mytilus coruscus TaxID=42192 RepID=A0A6J8E6H7_MYTCO|nr:unnamed protein product [Mytilus coruscus]
MEEGIQERQNFSYAVIKPSNQQNSSYVPAKPTNKTDPSCSTVTKQPVITTRRPPAFGQIVKKQVWVEEKLNIPGVVPGLQYLTSLDQVFVKQHIDMMEAMWEKANRYKILNNQSEQVYFVSEESDKWNRQFQGPDRGFNLRVFDNTSQVRVESSVFDNTSQVRVESSVFDNTSQVRVESSVLLDNTSRVRVESSVLDNTSQVRVESSVLDNTSQVRVESSVLDNTSQVRVESSVLDNTSQEVMRFSREHICCAGCCCGYCESLRQVLTVEAPVGEVIGYVRQEFKKSGPCYSVRDAEDTIVYKITGPCCVCDCPCNRIVSADDTEEVGVISKNLGIENYFGDADTFGAKFPQDIDVKIKAVLLGAIMTSAILNKDNNTIKEQGCTILLLEDRPIEKD